MCSRGSKIMQNTKSHWLYSKACVYLMERVKEIGYLPYQSNKGSVLACLGGEGKPLVLAAHVDTLGNG